MNFEIKTIDPATLLVIWTTGESIFDNIEALEAQSSIKGFSGDLVIDQLYLTGNDERRFISCPVTDGKLDAHRFHTIVDHTNAFRKQTATFLHNHLDIADDMYLTESERHQIRNQIVF